MSSKADTVAFVNPPFLGHPANTLTPSIPQKIVKNINLKIQGVGVKGSHSE